MFRSSVYSVFAFLGYKKISTSPSRHRFDESVLVDRPPDIRFGVVLKLDAVSIAFVPLFDDFPRADLREMGKTMRNPWEKKIPWNGKKYPRM